MSRVGRPGRGAAWGLAALLAVAGCGQLRYEGRTLADWRRDVESASPAVRLHAVAVLEVAGAPGVPGLGDALKSADPAVRWRAARALARLGPLAAEAVGNLMDRLARDTEVRVRVAVAEALGAIGDAATAAGPVLIARLADGDADVRASVALALGQLGESPTGVAALAALLHDPKAGVRASAATALGTIGPGAAEALPALHEALDDARPLVRRVAAEALSRIESD